MCSAARHRSGPLAITVDSAAVSLLTKGITHLVDLKGVFDRDAAFMTMEMDVTHSNHQVNKSADEQTGLTGAEVTVSRQVQFVSGRALATLCKISATG